ncbi:hypothetical protein EBZ39_19310 [bacterium]|nr:hypothetical protein [bacterium]
MKKYSDGVERKNLGQISEYLGYDRVYFYQLVKRGRWPSLLEGEGPWSLDEVEEAAAKHLASEISANSWYGQALTLLPLALEYAGDTLAAKHLKESSVFINLKQKRKGK